MSAPLELCPPRYSDGGTYYVCGRALSHELAMQLASRDPDRPEKIGPGQGLMLCWDCADDLTLLAGNTRAVREEWTAA